MTETLTDEALTEKGVTLLEENLGPVQALRFLALLSRESFDYQAWRDQHFAESDLDTLFQQADSNG